jgi:hypothetical protein
MRSKVFISHSSADKGWADQICSVLESNGISCWIAPRDILPGMSWADAIVRAIAESELLLLLISAQSNSSPHVAREVERADSRKLPILPVRLENVPLSNELSYFIGGVQWLDCPRDAFYLDAVVENVCRLTNTPLLPVNDPPAFWQNLDRGGITIIPGRFLQFEKFEASGLVGYGDTMALADVRAYLESLSIRNVAVSYADLVHDDLLKTNLILLGGPDSNRISRLFMDKVRSGLRFGNPARHEIGVVDAVNHKTYNPYFVRTREDAIDHAVVITAPNPFSREHTAIFVAGSYGYGTWGGIRFLTSREFWDHDLTRTNAAQECLNKVRVVGETPYEIKTLIRRELS